MLMSSVYYRSIFPGEDGRYTFTRHFRIKYRGAVDSVQRARALRLHLEKKCGYKLVLMHHSLPE